MAFSMNIKPEAVEIIKKKIDPDHQVVLLALNDGSNKYSKLGGTCTIYDQYGRKTGTLKKDSSGCTVRYDRYGRKTGSYR